ncbi:MAG: hypothetical protein KAJ21_03115 [Thermoplasmatales archaeon]|nr:hypothetical protein [Thermoplasmatales archaeon]
MFYSGTINFTGTKTISDVKTIIKIIAEKLEKIGEIV